MRTRGLLTFVQSYGTLGTSDAIIETEVVFLHVTSVKSLISINDLLLSPLSGLDGIDSILEEYGETIIDYIIENRQTDLLKFLELRLPNTPRETLLDSISKLLEWKTASLLDRFSQVVSISDNIDDSYNGKKRLKQGEKLPKNTNINEFFIVPANYTLVYKDTTIDDELFPGLPSQLNFYRYVVKLKMTFLRDELISDANIKYLFPGFMNLTPFNFGNLSVYTIQHDTSVDTLLVGFGDWFFNSLTHYKVYISGFGFVPVMLYCLPQIDNPDIGQGRFVYFDEVLYTDNTGVPYTIRNTFKSEITLMQGLSVSLGEAYPYSEDLLYNYNSGGDYISHEYAYYTGKFRRIEKLYVPILSQIQRKRINPVIPITVNIILNHAKHTTCNESGFAWLHDRFIFGDQKLTFEKEK